MENKQASLTLTDLETYPIILTSLQENMSKNNYSRLAAIGEKVIPDLPDSQEKRYIQKTGYDRSFKSFVEKQHKKC